MTQHELAELQRLSMPPSSANLCIKFGADDPAEAEYVARNGYAAPQVIEVTFVKSSYVTAPFIPQK